MTESKIVSLPIDVIPKDGVSVQPKTDRRQRVLAEAMKHFIHDGFERTSLDRIAACSSVSKTFLYEEFYGKEGLFTQVIHAQLGKLGYWQGSLKGDLTTALRQAAIEAIDMLHSPDLFGLYRTNVMAARKFPDFAAAIQSFVRNYNRKLALYLEDARADKKLSFEGQPIALANRYGSMVQEGLRTCLGFSPPTHDMWDSYAALATEIILHGCRGNLTVPQDEPAVPDLVPPMTGTAKMRMKPERFEALCDAALKEFVSHGFECCSIERIIAASGVSRATIYRLFTGKEGLFNFVVRQEIQRISSRKIMPKETGDDFERLLEISRTILDYHLQQECLALHRLVIEEAIAFPHLARAFYNAQLAPVSDALTRHFAQCQIAPPSSVLCRMFYALATNGLRYIVAEYVPDEIARHYISRQTAEIFWNGLSTPG